MATDVVLIFDAEGNLATIYADEEINVAVVKYMHADSPHAKIMPDGFKAEISLAPVVEAVSETGEYFDLLNEPKEWDEFDEYE